MMLEPMKPQRFGIIFDDQQVSMEQCIFLFKSNFQMVIKRAKPSLKDDM